MLCRLSHSRRALSTPRLFKGVEELCTGQVLSDWLPGPCARRALCGAVGPCGGKGGLCRVRVDGIKGSTGRGCQLCKQAPAGSQERVLGGCVGVVGFKYRTLGLCIDTA